MNEFLESYHLTGIAIGLSTFLIIGLFHPLVIKGEYFFGTRIWWLFLITGIACCSAALIVDSVFWASILGVTGFSAFWSIGEVFEQKKRVEKGWFPRNPRRNK